MTTSIIHIKRLQDRAERRVNYTNSTKYRIFKKKEILIKLYGKQRGLTELKTALAVESCQELILTEIEKLFNVKHCEVSKLINKLSTSKICDMVDCSSLITPTDIKEITSIMEEILHRELTKRFLISCNTSLELDYHPNQVFNLIEDWHTTMNRSLFITRQVEKWSKSFLNKAVKINFHTVPFFNIEKKLKLNSSLLKCLGIDANDQKAEFLIEMRKRLEGSIDSIKLTMIIDIKEKVAQVYYQIHDEVIDRRFLEKITLLEKELAEETRYSLMRREA